MVQSLCNACGIRQRKARRALAVAAAAANGTILPTPSPSKKQKVQHKDKRSKSHGGGETATKKKCKASYEIPSAGDTKKKKCFEDFLAISLRKHSACQRVFPQDEKEAAILLMALSCGLVHGWRWWFSINKIHEIMNFLEVIMYLYSLGQTLFIRQKDEFDILCTMLCETINMYQK